MTEPVSTTSRHDVRVSIVESAARLLHEGGARALTTRAVAEAAGVQGPTIYRLFGDKDGLIDAVAEHVMAAYVATKAQHTDEGLDPLSDLRAGWRIHVDFGLGNPELYALLSTPGRSEPSPATAAGTEILRGRVHRLAVAGMLTVSEERAVDLLHAAGTGTILSLLTTAPELRDTEVAEAMFDAVVAAVTGRPARPDPSGPTAAAVTFASILDDLPSLTDAERALMAEWVARSIATLQRI